MNDCRGTKGIRSLSCAQWINKQDIMKSQELENDPNPISDAIMEV